MTNEDLVQSLVAEGYLKTQAIIDAFLKIDRAHFVPQEEMQFAYRNEPLPIGFGQTISQPLTVAFMIELLAPQQGEKILDIGAGSGWQSALLAEIVRPHGMEIESVERKKIFPCVVAVERVHEIIEIMKKNLRAYEFEEHDIIKIHEGDGSLGMPKFAPYDKIIAAASADKIPDAWKKQVRVGGKIVAPVRDTIVVLEKKNTELFEERVFFGFSFVPLIEGR